MKKLSIQAAFFLLGAGGLVACAAGEQEVNKRQDKKAQLTEFNNILNQKDADAMPDKVEDKTPDEPSIADLGLPALKLAADANLATVKAADVLLINKVSATDFVIFGKDGKSWSYKPAAAAEERLKSIAPIVVNPEGSTLYSLPDNQFWFVSPERLGRHKAAAAGMGEEKTITVEQYSTATFLGDKAKIKVLYASAEEIILHLDSHIVIVAIKPAPAPAEIKQLPIDKLPVDLKGELIAGRSAGGYWFRSAAGLFILNKEKVEGDVSPWSKSVLTTEPSDLSSLAYWPDEAQKKAAGESLGLSVVGLLSDVAQTPVAAP